MFRSYKPLDKDLQKSTLPDAKPEKIDVQLTSELVKSKEAPVLDEIASSRFSVFSFLLLSAFV